MTLSQTQGSGGNESGLPEAKADNGEHVRQNTFLPCPFCGCDKAPVELGNQYEENFKLQCVDCKAATGRYRTRPEVISAWNNSIRPRGRISEHAASVSSEKECDCGGKPHGKACVSGQHEPIEHLPPVTTIKELRERFSPSAQADNVSAVLENALALLATFDADDWFGRPGDADCQVAGNPNGSSDVDFAVLCERLCSMKQQAQDFGEAAQAILSEHSNVSGAALLSENPSGALPVNEELIPGSPAFREIALRIYEVIPSLPQGRETFLRQVERILRAAPASPILLPWTVEIDDDGYEKLVCDSKQICKPVRWNLQPIADSHNATLPSPQEKVRPFNDDKIRRHGLPQDVMGLIHDLCYHVDSRGVRGYIIRAQRILSTPNELAARCRCPASWPDWSHSPNCPLGTK